MALTRGNGLVDATRQPFAIVSERGRLRDDERTEVVEALLGLLQRPDRMALVLELTEAVPLPDVQRAYVTAELAKRTNDIRGKWAAMAILLRDPLRHLPTAAFWIRASPVPSRVFVASNWHAALEWARAQI
jgi:hypothetical protein